MIFSKRHTLTSLFALTLAAAAANSAWSQTPPPPPGSAPGPMMEKMHQHRMAKHEKSLQNLKAQLKLSPAQEPAWNAFAASMQPPTAHGPAMDRQAMSKMSTPERLDAMEAMRAKRIEQANARHSAIKKFYAELSPEQKKTFDDHGMKMGRMDHEDMHGKHHHH